MMAGRDHAGGGGAAGRGILIVIIAVAVGAFLLARGFDGSDDPADGASPSDAASENGDPEDNGDDPANEGEGVEPAVVEPPTTTATPTTLPPVVTHPPGQVKVAAVNGRGTRGLAGAAADILEARGYVTAAKNAADVPVASSVIYYMATYGDDAKAVADALSAPADILAPAPSTVLTLVGNRDDVVDFNIFVVLGTDELIPVSVG